MGADDKKLPSRLCGGADGCRLRASIPGQGARFPGQGTCPFPRLATSQKARIPAGERAARTEGPRGRVTIAAYEFP